MTRPFTRDDAQFFHDGHRQYGDDVYRLAAWALAESERADALAAELAEARAELAAERGDESALLPNWRPTTSIHHWVRTDGTVGGRMLIANLKRWRVTCYGEPDIKGAAGTGMRLNARAAEAEARRIGLLVDADGGEVSRG